MATTHTNSTVGRVDKSKLQKFTLFYELTASSDSAKPKQTKRVAK